MRRAVTRVVAVWLMCMAGPALGQESLVGYWRFDKVGPQVADLSGKGHSATISGGKVAREDGRDVLALDGRQQIVVPSSPDLNLAREFTIEARLRLDEVGDGHTLVFKDGQYSIRVDWAAEGSKISFFVCADQQWEPRVSSLVPERGRWYHLVATWNGREAALWLDGEPFQVSRLGKLPLPSGSPLVIASGAAHGPGIRGAIDYVKVYRRVLSTTEIIRGAFDIQRDSSRPGRATPEFRFANESDARGWAAGPGATAQVAGDQLVVSSRTGRGLVLCRGLQAAVDKRDFLSLRMTTDAGSRGEVVFVTTKGAGRIPFETRADGRPHAYVLEPWTWPGWGGTLLALALVPSEVPGATARIDYLRVTEEADAEPELRIVGVFSDSAIPRAGRPETIVARFRNTAGPAAASAATLAASEGVRILGPATQPIPAIGYLEEREATWKVVASRPTSGECQVVVGREGNKAGEVTASHKVSFLPNPGLGKAAYVPSPVPAKTGKYALWTHYCPLWKEGTHTGWKAIEPWPDRKPVLGWYNEGDPEVADWHIKMMLEHGISGVVYCWYRTNKNAPVKQALGHAIHDGLLKAKYLPMVRFAIMWENGCGQGCGSAEDLVGNLLPFWIENYFSNPSYLRIDGKPVLYVWVPPNVTRDLGGSENVRKTLARMRAICRQRGLGGLHIVGCVGSQDRETLQEMAMEGWDASSAYGNGWRQPAKVRTVGDFIGAPYEGFVAQQEEIWLFKREHGLLPDIPSAMMGWDSRPWKETSFFWSDNTPEKFQNLCLRAKHILDSGNRSGPDKNALIFCCWNEFGEGHYIEPTRGYGYAYLDAIRDVFCEGPKHHVDLAPEDIGLGPYDSWYQRGRIASRTSATGPTWSAGELAAWTGMMGLRDLRVAEDGILRFTTVTNDPAIQSPALKLRASRYSRLVVEMRASQPTQAQVFWADSSAPAMSEAASAHAPVPADGRFHQVLFDLAANERWGGCLTGIRLDPAATEGVLVEIRAIRLE
jgi:hypothetical protein